MNSTGKFLVSALLIHAANLKKNSDTQHLIQIPLSVVPSRDSAASPMAGNGAVTCDRTRVVYS